VSSTQTESPQAPAPANTAKADTGRSRHLGLALVVIATAQLMVVLDAAIVNVALPHIQRALGFTGSGLEWVVTAYAVTFGGLLLLGGRSGDLLGRKRIFIAGLILFSAASLFGGFATSQEWLLASRAIQGVGGAMIAPTALALITTTFPQGPQRNRAFGVYAAMSGGGAAVGLVAGGLLTTYLSWRWVLFVNVPIGIVTALLARFVISESATRTGRFDLPGAITVTGGVALLVYGLSNASTDQTGAAHWGDPKVVISLVVSAVLLASFALIEAGSRHALLPIRLLKNVSRTGGYVVMLCLATAMFGIFFFLTIFVQEVLGYSALRSGLAFLPFAAAIVLISGVVSRLVARTGPRPLMIVGSAMTAGGMYWLSHISVHTTYLTGLLIPMLVTASGLGLLFVPLSLVALTKVGHDDAGIASSLLNTGQQVGGAIGLAALGSVTWTAVAGSIKNQAASAAAAAARAGHPLPAPKPGAAVPASILHEALVTGISRGFVVAAGIAALALVVVIFTIRLSREDIAATPAVPGEPGDPAEARPELEDALR
jgi:EmrB/QacA subfamily drug resistance transporter